MIGSFWNLCRACPSMPVDKLHSEYRSTYRWHEYTGPRQEVVRRAPQGGHANAVPPADEKRHDFGSTAIRIDEESHELPKLEPAMPRRKKYPDLAYRHHEFIIGEDARHDNDATDHCADRARSEERGVSHWRPSRRSKSEGPARTKRHLTNGERRRDSDPDIPDMEDTGRDSGLLKKAISKISTEYRLQFAWPQGHTSRRDAAETPRKSQSMGALKPAANAMIHRKRNDFETKDANASELEPLVTENTIKEEEYHKPDLQVYKKPYMRTCKKDDDTKHLMQNGTAKSEWIRECVELRKKAGEYKNRGWGSKLAPEADIYNKQVELWDQVSRRSSLSALSLASTAHKNYTKEEKDHENTKKTSPTKAYRNAENSARIMKDMIRHHLERTTGGTEFDGLILSPTREKLEPTIPKRDDDSRGSAKNSPKKNSPQKTALQKKNSLKSKSALKTARSQSVGPTEMSASEKRSPKRQSRSATATAKEKKAPTPAAPTTNAVAAITSNNVPATKRPRPSSLNTTASSRSKSSSVPSKHEDERLAKSKSNKNCSNESNALISKDRRRGQSASEKTEKNAPEVAEPDPIDFEPVVKSPPEPTRVKSPEQIIMRSPDPVNWTVPLDTGKTFTVTQNVREGDLAARPHSEVKAWTPPDLPPPIAQSAPPQLTEQCKDQAITAGQQQLDTSKLSAPNFQPYTVIRQEVNLDQHPNVSVAVTVDAPPVAGSSLDSAPTATATSLQQPKTCPYLESPAGSPTSSPTQPPPASIVGDVLQKARDRFDAFWGKNNSEEV